MADLADRISRAAVAALDLAPLDDRFSKLSRIVLTGGASRFLPVVDPREPIRYVVPVGLPHDRIEYGAVVVQESRVGIVWRDAASRDRSRIVRLDSTDTAQYSSVQLGGEPWTRFELRPDDPETTFLVPPLTSDALTGTLVEILHAVATQSSTPAAASPQVDATATQVLDTAPGAPPEPPPTPEAAATQVISPVPSPATPAQTPQEPSPSTQPPVAPVLDATQPIPTVEDATAASSTAATAAQPEAFAVFRDQAPESQAAAPPTQPRTAPRPSAPAPVSPPVAPERASSDTVRGFWMGLLATVAIGAAVIAVSLVL